MKKHLYLVETTQGNKYVYAHHPTEAFEKVVNNFHEGYTYNFKVELKKITVIATEGLNLVVS